MLSALITSRLSYWAMLLAEQPIHQWPVRLGPLVLESTLLNLLTPTADRDRTVSRCELLGEISLLSPGYLLSFERWPFHTEPPDH